MHFNSAVVALFGSIVLLVGIGAPGIELCMGPMGDKTLPMLLVPLSVACSSQRRRNGMQLGYSSTLSFLKALLN